MPSLSHDPRSDHPRHQVRELVCSYRAVRDEEGRIIRVPSLVLSDARTAVQTLAPLLADQPVELFGVACLSARQRLLAWHVVSRGTRDSTPVSMPDVFVPAHVTPGTVALIVLHNHPSGDPTPSPEDVALTVRLRMAATVLGIALLDHLVVGEAMRYYSFREHGHFGHPTASDLAAFSDTTRTNGSCAAP